MDQAGYICEGTCKAFITEEQFNGGLIACGAEVCALKGKPFVKGFKCQICNEVFPEGTEHKHE